jgi:hypothetical protein
MPLELAPLRALRRCSPRSSLGASAALAATTCSPLVEYTYGPGELPVSSALDTGRLPVACYGGAQLFRRWFSDDKFTGKS